MSQLARETSYSQSYVSNMLRTGLSEAEIRARSKARGSGKNTRGSKSKGIGTPRREKSGTNSGQNLIEQNAAKAHRGKTGETLVEASLRKEIALADQRELELQIRRGEMVPRHLMKEWIGDAFLGAKDHLLRMGPELKDQFAAETDPAKIEAMITDEIETALQKIVELIRKLSNESQSAAA